MGLNAYEYQCSRGVNIGENSARKLGSLARENGIKLSIHAPYYITLGTTNPDFREKSKMHLLKSMRAAKWMGATTVVFHPGTGGGDDRFNTMSRAKDLLLEILEEAGREKLEDIQVAVETMGKPAQLGNLEEVIEFCGLSPQVIPAVDFGHLHAAGGGNLKTKEDFAKILDTIEGSLGWKVLQNLHIHFSPIEFTRAGEKKHWTTLETQFGPDFTPLAELLAERNIQATVICESAGRQAEDALIYKGIYEKVKGA